MAEPRSETCDPSTLARFWEKVDVGDPDDCWTWVAGRTGAGYGAFRADIGGGYAHRFAYEALVGAIPDGHDIDHMCHNADETCAGGDDCPHRRCVNPAHLEPATRRQNAHRGRNGPRDECQRGHEMTEENSYWRPDGNGRMCRACIDERELARSN